MKGRTHPLFSGLQQDDFRAKVGSIIKRSTSITNCAGINSPSDHREYLHYFAELVIPDGYGLPILDRVIPDGYGLPILDRVIPDGYGLPILDRVIPEGYGLPILDRVVLRWSGPIFTQRCVYRLEVNDKGFIGRIYSLEIVNLCIKLPCPNHYYTICSIQLVMAMLFLENYNFCIIAICS